MKCRHYNQIVPGCAYCDSIIESERQERAERDRAVAIETLEGRLACETALVDTLRAEVARLRAALNPIVNQNGVLNRPSLGGEVVIIPAPIWRAACAALKS